MRMSNIYALKCQGKIVIQSGKFVNVADELAVCSAGLRQALSPRFADLSFCLRGNIGFQNDTLVRMAVHFYYHWPIKPVVPNVSSLFHGCLAPNPIPIHKALILYGKITNHEGRNVLEKM